MYQAEIQNGRIGVEPLLFTQFPVATIATTFSAKNSVTDSAAAGTALATGKKTYNGAISVGEDKSAIQTVAEKAKKAGKKVGVTTSVIGSTYSSSFLPFYMGVLCVCFADYRLFLVYGYVFQET